jgi:hypothetical protein
MTPEPPTPLQKLHKASSVGSYPSQERKDRVYGQSSVSSSSKLDPYDDLFIMEGEPDVILKDLRLIAEGSTGTVYYGRLRSTDEKVAVKVFLRKGKDNKQEIAMRNEILMHKTTQHPNIVEYLYTL